MPSVRAWKQRFAWIDSNAALDASSVLAHYWDLASNTLLLVVAHGALLELWQHELHTGRNSLRWSSTLSVTKLFFAAFSLDGNTVFVAGRDRAISDRLMAVSIRDGLLCAEQELPVTRFSMDLWVTAAPSLVLLESEGMHAFAAETLAPLWRVNAGFSHGATAVAPTALFCVVQVLRTEMDYDENDAGWFLRCFRFREKELITRRFADWRWNAEAPRVHWCEGQLLLEDGKLFALLDEEGEGFSALTPTLCEGEPSSEQGLCFARENTLYFYTRVTGLLQYERPEARNASVVSPGGRWLFDRSGGLLRSAPAFFQETEFSERAPTSIAAVAVGGCGQFAFADERGFLRVFSCAKNESICTFETPTTIWGLCFRNDGKELLVGAGRYLQRWSLPDGGFIGSLDLCVSAASPLRFLYAANGRFAVVFVEDGGLFLSLLNTEKDSYPAIFSLGVVAQREVWATLAFPSDDTLLVCFGTEKEACSLLYSTKTKLLLQEETLDAKRKFYASERGDLLWSLRGNFALWSESALHAREETTTLSAPVINALEWILASSESAFLLRVPTEATCSLLWFDPWLEQRETLCCEEHGEVFQLAAISPDEQWCIAATSRLRVLVFSRSAEPSA